MLEKDRKVILYGVGKCYRDTKDRLQCLYNVNYIADRKFDKNSKQKTYDGLPIIAKDKLMELGKCLVIICIYNQEMVQGIKKELKNEYIECKCYDEVLPEPWGNILEYDTLKELVVDGKYEDAYRNTIIFDNDIPKQISIRFNGVANYVHIGAHVYSKNGLFIECGTKGHVEIGEDSTFDKVRIDSSWSEVIIGRDCMFSSGICVRNTDGHHIFSAKDGTRINYSKPIRIGNHVWVGQNAMLLPGFVIEDNSIIGAGAITSGTFENNVIIAGNPARVIREDVIWDRTNTNLYNEHFMER